MAAFMPAVSVMMAESARASSRLPVMAWSHRCLPPRPPLHRTRHRLLCRVRPNDVGDLGLVNKKVFLDALQCSRLGWFRRAGQIDASKEISDNDLYLMQLGQQFEQDCLAHLYPE